MNGTAFLTGNAIMIYCASTIVINPAGEASWTRFAVACDSTTHIVREATIA